MTIWCYVATLMNLPVYTPPTGAGRATAYTNTLWGWGVPGIGHTTNITDFNVSIHGESRH